MDLKTVAPTMESLESFVTVAAIIVGAGWAGQTTAKFYRRLPTCTFMCLTRTLSTPKQFEPAPLA